MTQQPPLKPAKSKKVEYIELIYDLVFVYLLRQNNALLEIGNGSFFTASEFWIYLLSTLVILQIWASSVLYINRYGENSVLDHLFLFANMYFLLYLGVDTETEWYAYHTQYHVSWALVIVNLTIQYAIQAYKSRVTDPAACRFARSRVIVYAMQAALILATITLYDYTRMPLGWIALAFGFIAPAMIMKYEEAIPVSFEHLTERVMLFVVLTCGEMIMSVALYFRHGFDVPTIAYSAVAFTATAFILMSYGYIYNNVMDRERATTGRVYLMLHMAIIIALNDITVGMEQIRLPRINRLYSQMFMTASLLIYYWTLFLIARRTEPLRGRESPFTVPSLIASILFAALMMTNSAHGLVSLCVAACYTGIIFIIIVARWKAAERCGDEVVPHSRQ